MPLTSNLTPPAAIKRPFRHSRFGHEWTDNYAWLKDANWQAVMRDPSQLDAAIRAHLMAENSYTDAVTEPLQPLKDEIFAEMKGRLEPNSRGVPMPDGAFAYFHIYREGDQHGAFVRHDLSMQTPADEIVLDLDVLAKADESGFFDIGDTTHSYDHKWLAYSIDRKGSESYRVYLKSLESGETQKTMIDKSAGSLVWAADNRTLFWVERDEFQRPYAVRFMDMQSPEARPQTAYEEADPGFFVGLGLSDDRRFIEISAHNHTTSEIWRIPSNAPTTPPLCFCVRREGMEYSLHEQGGKTYILSNAHGATDFAIYVTDKASAAPETWEPFISHRAGCLILGMETFAHFLVRLEREDALPRIIIRDMRSGLEHSIEMDDPAYGLGLVSGYQYDTIHMHFSYASPTTPSTVFNYDMQSKERIEVKRQVVPSGHISSDYVAERIVTNSRDGVEIPVTLLRRKDQKADGNAPLLLYGYGSYGITIPASFRTSILSLVDRGFVYAIAHIRGGMAKGYQWYLDGKLEKKENTFNDFVDVGRDLVDAGWTTQGKIVAHGGSAGGLLVGAAVNQAPELFGGIIGAVPFVDVLNTMSDADLPLTPPEWPEWGNPLEDEAAFIQIRAYSPYENVRRAAYPPMLITAGLTDPRVTYWEPTKWAATLREHQTSGAPILLKVNMEAGHQGESGRYDSLKETALEYAFALSCAGLA